MNPTTLIALIVALGIASQWVGWRFRLPALVLMAASGLVVGPALGWIDPSRDFAPLFQPIISLSVAVILFEGGLNLRLHELREAAASVTRLVAVGVPLSWMLGTAAAHYVGGLAWPASLVFGAIMVVTGPTVVTPMLRYSTLNRRSASFLKWEANINDPIGALLATVVVEYFLITSSGGDAGVVHVLQTLGVAVLTATAVGSGAGYALGMLLRYDAIPDFLKAPVVLASVLMAYVLCNLVHDQAGLLAATTMGLVMGNMELPSMEEMRRFKEYVSTLLVSALFVMIASNLQVSTLLQLNWHSLALIVVLIFVVRPVAVMLATLGSSMRRRDRLLAAGIAPRGIVAAATAGVFGPALIDSGYANGEMLVPLIFAMIFATVVIHGFSIRWLARRLGLAVSPHGILIVGASPWSTELARTLAFDLNVDVLLADSAWHRLREARLAGVPVWYGEVLSDGLEESMRMNEISTVLAATSNDAYNALVCSRLSGDLGAACVFQLPFKGGKEIRKTLARGARGVLAFHEDARYEAMWQRHLQGWQVYKTQLTEGYTYQHFKRDCPDDLIMIGVLRGKVLRLHAAGVALAPKVGETLVYYAPRDTAREASTRKLNRVREKEENKQRAWSRGKAKPEAGQQ